MNMVGAKTAIIVALMALAHGAPALADFWMEVIEEPQGGGSWTVGLGLPSDSAYDFVSTRITTGEPYGGQAFLSFTMDGWNELGIYNDPVAKTAAAAGPFADNLGFTLHFSGAFSDPVHFDVAGFAGNRFLGAMHGYWPGWGVTTCVLEITPGDWDGDVGQIPAPGAALLGAIGLGLIVVVKRKL